MTIVSSVLEEDSYTQADGRRFVREIHTDHLGRVRRLHILVPVGVDQNTAMLARVPVLEADQEADEIINNVDIVKEVGSAAVLTYDYQTAANVEAPTRQAVRDEWREATGRELIMMGDWLAALTDPTLRNLFNKTQGEVDTLRANRLDDQVICAALLRTATGE